MIADVRTQIYTLLKTVTGLTAANVFFQESPPRVADPHCVFLFVSNAVDRDTGTEFNDIIFQVSLFGSNLDDLETLEGLTKTVLDAAELSLTDDYSAPLRRVTGGITRRETHGSSGINDVGNYWQLILEYMLMTDEKDGTEEVLAANVTLIKM